MPQLLTRKRLLLSKIESSYGVDAAPSGTDAILVRSLDITPQQSDVVQRDLVRPYLGNYEMLLANTRVEVTFEVEMAGSGTAGTAPKYASLLKACGMSETIVANTSCTYAPVSGSFSSATLYFFNDSIKHVVTGARGTFEINAATAAIPTIKFTMTGIYTGPVDASAPAVTYSAPLPLIFKNGNTSNFSLYSYSGALQSVSLVCGNSVTYRELVGGTKQVLMTDRKATGTVVLEAPSISTTDFFTAALGTGTGNLAVTHGTTAGNIVAISAGQVDIGMPTYSDLNGIQMLNLPLSYTPTTAGNDEFSIVVS